MKKRAKLLSLWILVLSVMTLVPQGQIWALQTEGSPAARKKIALVMKTLTNPFFIEMEKGARRAEKELNIDLVVKTGAQETSIEQQISIVEDLICSRVQGIVIAPGSSVDLIPVLKKAQDAKIPIVNIDNRLDPELSRKLGLVGVPFISVDNEKGAYLSAKFICDQIKKPAQAAIVEGIQAAKNAQQRKEGALRAFRESPQIRIVASETAHWKIDEAYQIVGKLFARYPKIRALFCANDMMALGAIHYLEKAQKGDVLIAAYDALEEAKKAIKAGKLQVTIDQQADVQGYLGIRSVMDLLAGTPVPPETLVDIRVVNRHNL